VSRVSTSSILHHLGSVEHLMRVGAHWTGRARREQLADRWRDEERALLARQLDYALSRDELDGVVALIDGLTVAACRPQGPVRTDHARDLLRRRFHGLDSTGLQENSRQGYGAAVVPGRARSWSG
jgi:hypothetical protein